MCLAIPGKVIELRGEDPDLRTARVSFGGIVKEVSLVLVPEATIGDHVLVHVGVALSIVDEDEAREVFACLERMGELEELAIRPADHDAGSSP